MNYLTFKVVSDPKPQPRPRARVVPLGNGKVRAGVYTKQDKCADWRADVLRAVTDAGFEGLMIDAPLIVMQRFLFRRPMDHFGSGKNASKLKDSAPPFPTGSRNGDFDNLAKGLTDVLIRGRVIKGDNQIVAAPIFKFYAREDESPGALVGVLVLDGAGERPEDVARNLCALIQSFCVGRASVSHRREEP